MRKYLTDNDHWFSFYNKLNCNFYLNKAGYFDERPELVTGVSNLLVFLSLPFLLYQSTWFLLLIPFIVIGWGKLYIKLPYKTGIQDCESATWGVAIHNNTFWIYIGGGGNFEGGRKWISWNIPFLTKNWVRTSILLKDGSWEHEINNKERKQFWKDEWKEKQASWSYDYTDNYDKSIIPTTIYLEEREWRPKWLNWTNTFAIIKRSIDVYFSNEVGKEKDSWKGGTIKCSYTLLPNETPLEGLKRLEKEINF